MRSRADGKVDVGWRHIQVAEKCGRHAVIVVLAGMNECLRDFALATMSRGPDGCHLHEIRTGTDNVDNRHHSSSELLRITRRRLESTRVRWLWRRRGWWRGRFHLALLKECQAEQCAENSESCDNHGNNEELRHHDSDLGTQRRLFCPIDGLTKHVLNLLIGEVRGDPLDEPVPERYRCKAQRQSYDKVDEAGENPGYHAHSFCFIARHSRRRSG